MYIYVIKKEKKKRQVGEGGGKVEKKNLGILDFLYGCNYLRRVNIFFFHY